MPLFCSLCLVYLDSMSVGTMDEPSHSRSNEKYGSNRPGSSSPMHKSSFKIGKPKHSKARMLSKSELIGMGSSALLSILIALLIVFVGIKGSPIVLNNLMNFFNDVTGGAVRKDVNNSVSTLNKANVLALQRNVSHLNFVNKFYGKSAGIFDFSISKEVVNQHYESWKSLLLNENTQIQLKSLNKFDYSSVDVQFSDVLLGDFDTTLLLGAVVAEAEIRQPLCSADATCPWLSDDTTLPILKDFEERTTLVLGKNNSVLRGPSFRSDRQLTSELLHGSKRWFVYKPNKLPSAGVPIDRNLDTWLDKVYPLLSLSDMPIEMHQVAGQVVYIPEGWYHATVTTSENSVSLQRYTSQEDRNSYYHYLRVGRGRYNEGDFVGANKMFKLGLALCRDPELLFHFALSLEKVGLHAQARDALYEMITRNKSDPTGYVHLINLLVTHFSDAYAEASSESGSGGVSIPVLLEMAEQNHVRDIVLLHCQDSM